MLSKVNRLTKRGSFTFVYNKGQRSHAQLFNLVFVQGKNLRIGFSVPNKIGKATTRNLLKRRLRAICRMLVSDIKPAQMVFTAKAGAEELSFREVEKTVKYLLQKAKLLN